MDTATVKVADIHPATYNPRKTLRPGDKDWEALKDSMDRFGVAEPLIVNRRTGNLVSGHQRLNVLKASGVEEVEVVLVDLDPDQEKLCNVALNKIDGDWDYVKLEALFNEIPDENIRYTGFSTEELRNLFERDVPKTDDAFEPTAESGEEETGESGTPQTGKDETFTVYLSFPKKEDAENWLREREIETGFEGTSRNLTIRMEGYGYGA